MRTHKNGYHKSSHKDKDNMKHFQTLLSSLKRSFLMEVPMDNLLYFYLFI